METTIDKDNDSSNDKGTWYPLNFLHRSKKSIVNRFAIQELLKFARTFKEEDSIIHIPWREHLHIGYAPVGSVCDNTFPFGKLDYVGPEIFPQEIMKNCLVFDPIPIDKIPEETLDKHVHFAGFNVSWAPKMGKLSDKQEVLKLKELITRSAMWLSFIPWGLSDCIYDKSHPFQDKDKKRFWIDLTWDTKRNHDSNNMDKIYKHVIDNHLCVPAKIL